MNPNNQVVLNCLKDMQKLWQAQIFVAARDLKTVELLNATLTFDANASGLIDIPKFSTSKSYVDAELFWYDMADNKTSFISDFASMWEVIANDRGFVNSNYGHLIYSPQNCNQYDNVLKELQSDKESRRAIMVYCPNHIHYTGGNDYVCTMYVSYMVRNNALHAFVSMRSCDLRFGLVGADLAWQIFVLRQLAQDLGVGFGTVNWHACSLHLYERHFGIFEEI